VRVHSLKALDSWLEALIRGSLNVRSRSECPLLVCGLLLWSWDGLEGDKVILFPSLEKVQVFK